MKLTEYDKRVFRRFFWIVGGGIMLVLGRSVYVFFAHNIATKGSLF